MLYKTVFQREFTILKWWNNVVDLRVLIRHLVHTCIPNKCIHVCVFNFRFLYRSTNFYYNVLLYVCHVIKVKRVCHPFLLIRFVNFHYDVTLYVYRVIKAMCVCRPFVNIASICYLTVFNLKCSSFFKLVI